MARTEITYDMIESLIVDTEVNGRQVFCTFGLPGSDEVFQGDARITAQRTVGGQVKRQVTRSLVNEARRTASRMLRGLFGGGALGRIGSQTVRSATNSAARDIQSGPSKAEKREAIVRAFRKVQSNFYYDPVAGKWGKPSPAMAESEERKELVSPFQEQLNAHPVRSGFERDILARVLAHMAYADGELAGEELDFFKESIPASIGTVEELGKRDPVSAIEAGEIEEGVRESIYMLAWTISSIDMDVDDAEVAMLNDYAGKFSIAGDRAQELTTMAKSYVLEGYMQPDLTRDELFELAGKIGMSNDDAERAKISWMKRQ